MVGDGVWTIRNQGAATTCELIGDGFLGQPANAISSLALVAGGVLLITRPRVRWIGIALAGAGIGSFLSHGPMPLYSDWVHDVSLGWLLLVVAATGTRWERQARWIPLPVLGLALALVPAVAEPAGVALAVLAVGSVLMRDRSARTLAPLGLLAVAGLIGRLGDTGGPLCDPTSLLQPHALWHLGAAAALTWWGTTFVPLPLGGGKVPAGER